MNEASDRWLMFAREDLRAAQILLPEGIYSQACFHAQQCVEKCLKAALARAGQSAPRTHSITDLLSLLPSDEFADLRNDLVELDDYYVPTRYPDVLPGTLPEGLPGKAQAQESIVLARTLLDRVADAA
jgi:HEPN domain-containing protein